MSYRDDREVLAERVARLEKELDAAQTELARAKTGASAASTLEKQLGKITRERNALRAGIDPDAPEREKKQRALVLAGVVVSLAFVVGWQLLAQGPDPVRARCEHRLTDCESERTALEGDLEDAQRQLSHIEDEHSAELARLAPTARTDGVLVRAEITAIDHGWGGSQRQLAIGMPCQLVVATFDHGACRAVMTCDDRTVFGRGGERPTCDVGERAVVPGSDAVAVPVRSVRYGTPGSGTSSIAYDAAARTIELDNAYGLATGVHLRVVDVTPLRFP